MVETAPVTASGASVPPPEVDPPRTTGQHAIIPESSVTLPGGIKLKGWAGIIAILGALFIGGPRALDYFMGGGEAQAQAQAETSQIVLALGEVKSELKHFSDAVKQIAADQKEHEDNAKAHPTVDLAVLAKEMEGVNKEMEGVKGALKELTGAVHRLRRKR